MAGRLRRRPRRAGGWCASPPPAPWPLWHQLAVVTGLLALSALVCAAVLPSRVRSLTRAFGIEGILDVHRFLGIASAVLVLLHLACVVATNPAKVALLDPALNGPPAKAASVATAALVVLVVLAAARRRLEQRYELWRWIHVALAVTVLGVSALHVCGSTSWSTSRPCTRCSSCWPSP